MNFWPGRPLPPMATISSASFETGQLNNALTSYASAAYPAANRAIFIPFVLTQPILVTVLFSANGSVVSGNIDVGLYSADLTRIISAGSVAQAGVNAIQVYDIADTLIGPGRFYLAVALSSTTGQLHRASPGAQFARRGGIVQMASALPLPATATAAATATSYIPLVGLRWAGTII